MAVPIAGSGLFRSDAPIAESVRRGWLAFISFACSLSGLRLGPPARRRVGDLPALLRERRRFGILIGAKRGFVLDQSEDERSCQVIGFKASRRYAACWPWTSPLPCIFSS